MMYPYVAAAGEGAHALMFIMLLVLIIFAVFGVARRL
jgi:hypothetical protein